MKKYISIFLLFTICSSLFVGCIEEEPDLSFHGRLSTEYYETSMCFKRNGPFDEEELDYEAVEKNLSTISELMNDTTATEQERTTAYVFHCYFSALYKIRKGGHEIDTTTQDLKGALIIVFNNMTAYVTSSDYIISEKIIRIASDLDRLCDEYLDYVNN